MHYKTRHFIRRAHRFLGVFAGIQLLTWTLGGLYFAWSDLDEVHGDYDKKPMTMMSATDSFAPVQMVLANVRAAAPADSLMSMNLVNILGQPHWQITAHAGQGHDAVHQIRLADAITGQLRAPLTESEAVDVAKNGFIGDHKVIATKYLTDADGHHEFRGGPFPAVAVTFDDERSTTVYVSTEYGTIEKFRNKLWRRFDFLWMLHTMDYSTRDHITNWILRIASVVGLVTILSGFLLFFTSIRRKRDRR